MGIQLHSFKQYEFQWRKQCLGVFACDIWSPNPGMILVLTTSSEYSFINLAASEPSLPQCTSSKSAKPTLNSCRTIHRCLESRLLPFRPLVFGKMCHRTSGPDVLPERGGRTVSGNSRTSCAQCSREHAARLLCRLHQGKKVRSLRWLSFTHTTQPTSRASPPGPTIRA